MPDDRPYVFHRHPDEGPPRDVRVGRLPATSLAEWATRLRFPAEDADDPWTIDDELHQRLLAELGGHVHGVTGIGLAAAPGARTEGLRVPRDLADAWERWGDVAYEIGFRSDGHSLRVYTDDDELESVYLLVDAAVVRSRPERFSYLLHTAAELPGGSGPTGFVPEPELTGATGAGAGPGAVFVANFSVDSSSGIDEAGFDRIDGVRLPELLADPAPLQEHGLEWVPDALADALPAARAARVARVNCAEHDADEYAFAGEIVLFDDLWAGAHPDLAASVLWTAHSWDPLGDPHRGDRDG
jgi:hypothetical protein